MFSTRVPGVNEVRYEARSIGGKRTIGVNRG